MTPVTAACPKLTGPLAVSPTILAVLKGRQFGFQFFDDPCPVTPLTLLILRIVAHRIATTALPITNHHLFDPQVASHVTMPSPAGQDLLLHLAAPDDRHTYDAISGPGNSGPRPHGQQVLQYDPDNRSRPI